MTKGETILDTALTYVAMGTDIFVIRHQQSLAIKREIGDRGGEAKSYGNLGNVYYSLGEYQKAIEILSGQFGYGTLTARIITPAPFH